MALGSAEEIELCVRGLLRPGEEFSIRWDSSWWVADIKTADGLIWDHAGYDPRILLLDAYGFLWKRVSPPHTNPFWQRKREVTPARVAQRAVSHGPIPDPEDIDPEEVASVYESHHHGRKV